MLIIRLIITYNVDLVIDLAVPPSSVKKQVVLLVGYDLYLNTVLWYKTYI